MKKIRSVRFRPGDDIKLPRGAEIINLYSRDGEPTLVFVADDRSVHVRRKIVKKYNGDEPEGEYLGTILISANFMGFEYAHFYDCGEILEFGDE